MSTPSFEYARELLHSGYERPVTQVIELPYADSFLQIPVCVCPGECEHCEIEGDALHEEGKA